MFPSSSQENSLPLSEESCLYLLNQLGSPLNEFVNRVSGLSGANVTHSEGCLGGEEVAKCLSSQIELPSEYMLENVLLEPKIAPSSLPATENWPGDYHFNVTFRMQENVKGAQYIYSDLKNKLYVRKDAPCPINFSTNTIMTDDVCIRAMALFSSSDHASEIVHRCVNHSMAEIQRNLPEAEHLIRCESRCAIYLKDQNTGRHSVVVPFENPPAGQQFSCYIYKFACFGSCSGGPNRRPLMLVFTLERGGAVIGRQRVDLKICACPSRDMKLEEKQLDDKKPIKRKSSLPKPEIATDDIVPNFHTAVKKMRPIPEKGPYWIRVQDKKCYEFMKHMKRCYSVYLNSGSESSAQDHAIKLIRSMFSSSEDEGS